MAVVLNGKIREGRGKGPSRRLRSQGLLPAVVYGGKSTVCLSLKPKELKKLLDKEGVNTLIELNIEGDTEKKRVVVLKDHDQHPIREGWVHADFLEVDMQQEIKVEVPIILEGRSPGEKLGGMVELNLHTLEVKCLPGNIPESIKVDMTQVLMDQVVHVSDLNIPENVEVIANPGESVVSVHEVKVKEAKAGEEEGLEGAAEGAAPAAKAEGEGKSADADKK